jgi:exopolysaccharide biosynthesis polyprenyl glycosylphosphotransferase
VTPNPTSTEPPRAPAVDSSAELNGHATAPPANGFPAVRNGDGAAAPLSDRRRGDRDHGSRLEVIRARDALFRRSLAVADVLSVAIALVVGAVVFGDDQLRLAALAVPPAFVVLVKSLGLYDRDEHLLHKSTLDELPALFGLATLGALVLWLLNGAIVDGALDRGQVLAVWGLLLILVLCLRTLARVLAQRVAPTERCLLVGDEAAAAYVRKKLLISPAVKAALVGVVPPGARHNGAPGQTELPHELGPVLIEHGIDRVILATEAEGRDDLLYVIRELKSFGVKVSVLPQGSRIAGSSVELDHLHGMTLLGMRRFEFTRSSRFVKRAFDLVGTGVALALLAPLFLVVALAIKLDSPGAILFRQRRIGRHGDEFQMLKFRSMVRGADRRKLELAHLNEGEAGLFKIADDPRVTRVGRVIRRLQIDELPQLINVLRGEMSLVGPRPLIPQEDRRIEGWYRRRLDVPPGITGHWQVLGSSTRIPLAEMVKLDYLYVANWSLWGDVRLILRTLGFLASRRGV